MAQAILMGGGAQSYPVRDGLRNRDIYGRFTNYTAPNATEVNPVGNSATYSAYDFLKDHFIINLVNDRIIFNKQFTGIILAYSDGGADGQVVVYHSDGTAFISSENIVSRTYNSPWSSTTPTTFIPGDYIQFTNYGTGASAAECYKTVIITKEAA